MVLFTTSIIYSFGKLSRLLPKRKRQEHTLAFSSGLTGKEEKHSLTSFGETHFLPDMFVHGSIEVVPTASTTWNPWTRNNVMHASHSHTVDPKEAPMPLWVHRSLCKAVTQSKRIQINRDDSTRLIFLCWRRVNNLLPNAYAAFIAYAIAESNREKKVAAVTHTTSHSLSTQFEYIIHENVLSTSFSLFIAHQPIFSAPQIQFCPWLCIKRGTSTMNQRVRLMACRILRYVPGLATLPRWKDIEFNRYKRSSHVNSLGRNQLPCAVGER